MLGHSSFELVLLLPNKEPDGKSGFHVPVLTWRSWPPRWWSSGVLCARDESGKACRTSDTASGRRWSTEHRRGRCHRCCRSLQRQKKKKKWWRIKTSRQSLRGSLRRDAPCFVFGILSLLWLALEGWRWKRSSQASHRGWLSQDGQTRDDGPPHRSQLPPAGDSGEGDTGFRSITLVAIKRTLWYCVTAAYLWMGSGVVLQWLSWV